MKYLLIIMFFIQLSAIAEANNSAVQVCDNMSTNHRTSKCLNIIAGKVMNDSAVQVCDNMSTNHRTSECLNIIAGKVMNDSAVQVCDNMSTNHRTSECLNIIAGKVMNDSAVQVCDNMSTDHRTSECLNIIAGKVMNDSAVQVCDNMSTDHRTSECLKNIDNKDEDTASIRGEHYNNNREKIKGAAIEFCRNEIASYLKNDCLNIVAPSRFIDAGAFNLCKKQPSHRQIECLSVIANKTYHPALIKECSEKSSHRQGECLSKYGSPIDSQEDKSVVIIIQNGEHIQQGLSECKHENFHGLYPEGGGCNFQGCWIAGGGCNFQGCWYPGGGCNFQGCVKEAPKNNICQ